MLEDTLLIAASLKSLLSEVLDWPSVLHNSKFRVPGEAVTPVITIVFQCIYFCVHSSVNIHQESFYLLNGESLKRHLELHSAWGLESVE